MKTKLTFAIALLGAIFLTGCSTITERPLLAPVAAEREEAGQMRASALAAEAGSARSSQSLEAPGAAASATAAAVVALSWQDNSGNETGFKLERSIAAGAWQEIVTVAANIVAYTDTAVAFATTYWYRVRAYNGAGHSAYSNTAVFTTPPVPETIPNAPSGLQAVGSLVNLSARGFVGTGDAVLIAGFVVQDGARDLLVRAVGPTLERFAVAGVLRDPVLEVRDAGGALVARNDNWSDDAALAAAALGARAFALDAGSADAALLLSLAPGLYTAVVSGHTGTGITLAEVYTLAAGQQDPVISDQ